MKKKINISTLFLIAVIVVYVFASVIGAIITDMSTDYWEGFGILSFSTVVAVVLLLVFANKNTDIEEVFFNAPIYYVGVYYYAVAGIFALLHMFLGILSFKWAVVIQLITFALFVVFLILSLVGKTNARNVIEKKVEKKNEFIRAMTASVNSAAACCEDRELKKKLELLAEEFQFSSPASAPDLYAIEDALRLSVGQLETFVKCGNTEEAEAMIVTVKKGIIKRSEICKGLK